MRFCPFCSAENAADAVACGACNRRLPPPPNRRARTGAVGGPPTGMIATGVEARPATAVAAPVIAASTLSSAPTAVLPPPAPPPDDARRALTTALVPPPSALRRTAPPPEPRRGVDARRRDDGTASAPAIPPVRARPPSDATAPVDDDWLVDATEAAALATPMPGPTPTPIPTPIPSPIPTPTPIPTPIPSPIPTPIPIPSPIPTPSPSPIPTPTPSPPPRPPLPAAALTISPAPDDDLVATREPSGVEPPPTRILRTDGTDDRPFIPPTVMPVPEIPDGGLANAARYAVAFARARWQRSRAVKLLRAEINSDTAALDGVLLTLGREARAVGFDNRVLAGENAAITDVEKRRESVAGQGAEVLGRKQDENVKFEEIERQRVAIVTDAERVTSDAQRDVTTYEAQRRSLRDKRKDLERRQKAYLQAAEARESDAERSPMGDARAELRRTAEGHRREAASLDPERQDLERKIAAVERPLSSAQAKLEAAKAELDAAKRALADAREGHRHRLAELDAEHARKLREHELAEAEIVRRLVTLGTLINLNRIARPEFAELYQRIDRLRTAINARTTEIDRLIAERAAYDRPSLLRGYAVLAGVVVLIIAFIAIILAAT